ncbi:hypothetical protein O3P69_017987 [Scylla paramamosain]|uniref:receptor protein-tyrosine kinase n=1 Tax=Scylla paramamosain TaxID=85552 RepID=A0AAW0TH12_SCYPA
MVEVVMEGGGCSSSGGGGGGGVDLSVLTRHQSAVGGEEEEEEEEVHQRQERRHTLYRVTLPVSQPRPHYPDKPLPLVPPGIQSPARQVIGLKGFCLGIYLRARVRKEEYGHGLRVEGEVEKQVRSLRVQVKRTGEQVKEDRCARQESTRTVWAPTSAATVRNTAPPPTPEPQNAAATQATSAPPRTPAACPAHVLPAKPQNITVNFVDQSTVILAWQPPLNEGGRTDTLYRVVCDACGSHVSYYPPQMADERFNATQVTISGLNPVTTYRFQVFAENGVSKQAPEAQYLDITVTTEASGRFMVIGYEAEVPSTVSNVRVTSVKSTEISLAWDAPSDPYSDIEMYEVRYYVRDQHNNSSSILTKKEESSLVALRQGTDYGFQVRAKTTHGWGKYSPPIYKRTGQLLGTAYVGDEDNTQVRIIVGATVGAFVVIAVIVIMTLLFLRSRGTDECNKKQPSDCDTLEYRNGEVHGVLENPPIVQTHTTGSMTTPLFTQVGHHRTYIDPHTYEDPNQAIREFAREIDASYITIEAIIGGGEFGDVCKGKLQLPSRPEMTVAIKTLKPGSSEKARVDFLTEASIMGQFEHPNVIFLQGVVTKSNPVMIITEYMENGSLDHFLRVNDGKFQVLQLVGMMRCIASGMQYLSEMNYVHRDLAARNVLVNGQLICKIADFGLSREIESHTEGAYTTRGGKIPVRWTAPEAIAFRKFTSASDVWSLGIVMWEVMSYGERPYWNWSNQDVIKSIEKGYRLPAPMECPEAIYQLMLDCWQKERNHRPNFASIVRTLDRLIRTPEALNKVAQNRCTTALGLDSVDMTQLTSVEDWLASLKMSRYVDNFQRTGLTDLEAVARLTQHDLTQLGITLVGHQKKILQSIHTLRTQLAVNMSEGFLV